MRHHAASERCGETDLNTFEQRNPDEFSSSCGAYCDAFAGVQRGAITKAFNVGLRMPQRKELNVDTYNQGCLNPWGCVNNDGYSCVGPVEQRFGAFMRDQFRALNAPYDPSQAEYAAPPVYSMGWKSGGPNAVTGWLPSERGFIWEKAAPTQLPCPGPKSA